jgi:hypothetical protein
MKIALNSTGSNIALNTVNSNIRLGRPLIAPVIIPELVTSSSLSFSIINLDSRTLPIYYLVNQGMTLTPTTSSSFAGTLAPGQRSSTFSISSLSPDTIYIVSARAYFDDGVAPAYSALAFEVFITQTAEGTGGQCLEKNTILYMADGTSKKIIDVEVGEYLLGFDLPNMPDESTSDWMLFSTDDISQGGNVPVKIVSKIVSTWHYYFEINNDIKITVSHPFFIKKARSNTWSWVDSSYLAIGDSMLGKDGEEIIITSYNRVNTPIEVVELDTEQTDNYFAGNTPVLVHNNNFKVFEN